MASKILPEKKLLLLLTATILLFLITPVFAEQNTQTKTVIYFFWGDGCPHCSHEKVFLDELKQKYPEIEVKDFETWRNPNNAKLFSEVSKAYGVVPQGVPTTFIGQKHWVGYSDSIDEEFEDTVKECIESGCEYPEKLFEIKELFPDEQIPETFCIHFFLHGECPQCADVLPFIESLSQKHNVKLELHDVSVPEKKELYEKFKETYGLFSGGYPIVFIGKNFLAGDTAIRENLEKEIISCKESGCACPLASVQGSTPYNPQPGTMTPEDGTLVNLPFFGEMDASQLSLPVFTIILGGLDSFNPCAFFVLFFLLSMLVHAKSRKRMLLIGGTFVFFSGFIYFLFMAAWLNLFLFIGELMIITTIAGAIAVIVGVINVKDFFFFGEGVSLSISSDAKPKLFQRMRGLLKETSLLPMMVGTIVLAIAANAYELLCTAGFPMVFTRILTLHELTTFEYYLYLAAYNVVYIIPLALIVLLFSLTLGAKKLTEWQGRVLKLVSGLMMFGLGAVLLSDPSLMNNIFVSAGLLVLAISVTVAIIFITKLREKKEEANK
jgi:thiol-disulfide isomerase/thioredoxin